MSDGRLVQREEQARLEVGRTDVSRGVAAVLIGLFLLTIASGSTGLAIRSLSVEKDRGAMGLGDLARQVGKAFSPRFEEGFFARNRMLHRAIDDLESRVEEAGWMRGVVRPRAQALLTGWLGVGNEQVYLGTRERDGSPWLYFRPSVDHLTRPPFLSPRVLERRSLGGDEWVAPPHADPLVAIEGWAEALGRRGIRLMLVPTPVKPSIRPGPLQASGTGQPLRNPAHAEFLDRVRNAGAEVYDPAADLMNLAAGDAPVYLRMDTHWRPEAVESVAEGLAGAIREWSRRAGVGFGVPTVYRRQSITVSNRGDLFDLLGLPTGQSLFDLEEVTIERVVDSQRRLWRAEPAAEILLLGDSFTNVYSMSELGWGEGGGLAEQLSYFLGWPVDKLAVNAGGAYGARERLVSELLAGHDRLAGKRLVIWQFAERELSIGDWKPLPLPQ